MRILIFTALLGLYSIAHAQDYREEITEHVIKPCALDAIEANDIGAGTGLSVDEVLTFILLRNSVNVDALYETVFEEVRNLDEDSRHTIYELSLKMCLHVMNQ